MNTDMLVLLLVFENMSYYQMITWMKNANIFRMSEIQPQGVA